MQSPKLLAKSPSHSLNAEMLSLKILMLLQFAPPPQLLHPPGLHLPGCSPPLQLPGPGHCRAGYLLPGHKQNYHHNDDDDDGQDLGRQLEEIGFQKLGLRKIGFKAP